MIRLVTDDARIVWDGGRWLVCHPSNDAILAYVDTKAEAQRVVDAFNDLARQLRDVGEKVR